MKFCFACNVYRLCARRLFQFPHFLHLHDYIAAICEPLAMVPKLSKASSLSWIRTGATEQEAEDRLLSLLHGTKEHDTVAFGCISASTHSDSNHQLARRIVSLVPPNIGLLACRRRLLHGAIVDQFVILRLLTSYAIAYRLRRRGETPFHSLVVLVG